MNATIHNHLAMEAKRLEGEATGSFNAYRRAVLLDAAEGTDETSRLKAGAFRDFMAAFKEWCGIG